MLQCLNISKNYGATTVLNNITLEIADGEFLAIMGPSGSGKTTFLNVLSTIDTPTSGEILINNTNPHNYSAEKLALFRRRQLGIIFQDFNLIPTLSIEENIALPLTLDGYPLKEMKQRTRAIARELGIDHILKHRIHQVSGGQAQRTAIARASIHHPDILLADEPTGNLDTAASKDVMHLLSTINKEKQMTILLVTHDPIDASYCNKVVFMNDGNLDTTLYKTGSRHDFYQNIMKKLSEMEGVQDEV